MNLVNLVHVKSFFLGGGKVGQIPMLWSLVWDSKHDFCVPSAWVQYSSNLYQEEKE